MSSFVVNSKRHKRYTFFTTIYRSAKFFDWLQKFNLNFAICPVWLGWVFLSPGLSFSPILCSVSWLLLSTQIAATRQSHVKLTLLFYISLFVSNLSLVFFTPAVLDILETLFRKNRKKKLTIKILSLWRKFYHYSSKFC